MFTDKLLCICFQNVHIVSEKTIFMHCHKGKLTEDFVYRIHLQPWPEDENIRYEYYAYFQMFPNTNYFFPILIPFS